MGEGEDDGSAIFIANSEANFIAVIGEYLEIKYESLPSLTRNTIRRMVVQRAYSKWLMSVAISLRFSWFYGPFVGGGSGETRSTERNLLMVNLSAGRNGNVIRLFETDRWKLINISSTGIGCNFSPWIYAFDFYIIRDIPPFFIVIFIYFVYSRQVIWNIIGGVICCTLNLLIL